MAPYSERVRNQAVIDHPSIKRLMSAPVLVAALGYFVDIYDLLLFGIVQYLVYPP